MEFKECKLEDIISDFKYGRMPEKNKIKKNGQFPIFTGYLISGFYDESNVNGETLIVVARGVGGTGDVKLTSGSCFLTNLSIQLKNNELIVTNKYLYYYFKIKNLRYLDSGSAQSQITINDLKRVTVHIPSIENQNKIVKILSDIDKKIELNNEINNNLFEITKQLYKRWFIDFEFPNEKGNSYKSDGGKMVASELGMIPENWEVGFIDDGKLTKIIKSGVAKFEKEKKYIATADVEKTTMKSFTFIDYNSKPSRANMTPIPNSIWFAKMQDSVKNMMVASYMNDILDNYIFSTGFMGVECLKNSIFYIWNYINSDVFSSLKNNLSTGTLMAGISNTTIVGCKYVIPTEIILNLFNNEMQKINELIYNNEQENIVLEKLRDTLLPKLMNGEIDLENIEI